MDQIAFFYQNKGQNNIRGAENFFVGKFLIRAFFRNFLEKNTNENFKEILTILHF